MKRIKETFKKFLYIILSAVLIFETPLSVYAANPAVKTSNYVITKMKSAQDALDTLQKDRPIQAVVYLKDVYTIRESADAYSKSVATVSTGTSVNITGVDADSGRNIWYKVECAGENNTYTGYIERDFLAYSDERLLKWEDTYVTTLKREAIQSNSDCADIEQFPSSYKDSLYALKKSHPDWIFVKQDVPLNWANVIAEESSGARSLIDTNGTPASRMDGMYGAGWAYASDGSIAYYMDPRNFLSEPQIFQFELLSYNPTYQKKESVSKILSGTFMSGNIEGTSTSYADYFMTLGSKYNISPILQASRVYSEQGNNGSALIYGTYSGYENLYNYYNIGASGQTTQAIITSGLTYARKKGWTSRMAALEGGAAFLANDYVSQGQDTLYLQKWDMVGTPYTHQYMQAVYGAYSNAKSTYNGYKASGVLNTCPFVFKIPVYANMPAAKQINPATTDQFSINMDKVENLPVDQSAVVIPYINDAINKNYEYTFKSSNGAVATVDGNGVITGMKPGTATISVSAVGLGTLSCAVSVIKADVAVADVKKPEIELTYNPECTLASVELPSGFTWIDSDIVPIVNNEGYSVTYVPDTGRYNSVVMTIPVTVMKAQVAKSDLEIPNDLEIAAGSELMSVPLPEHFAWKDCMATVPTRAGEYQFEATYCPDENNYDVTEDIQVPIKVFCAEHNYGEWSEPSGGYIVRTCSICDAEERLEVSEQVTDKDCTVDGHDIVDGKCTRCGYEEPVVEVHEHAYSVSECTATCTEAGVTVYTCSCGDSYVEDAPALGHNYVNGKCDNCGAVVTPSPQITKYPTLIPTTRPTPSITPRVTSTVTPVSPTKSPSPTVIPTKTPTAVPTKEPTKEVVPQVTKLVTPTAVPTKAPTKEVVAQVTKLVTPTAAPTTAPTQAVVPQVTKTVTTTAESTTPQSDESTSNVTMPSIFEQLFGAKNTDAQLPEHTVNGVQNTTETKSTSATDSSPEHNVDRDSVRVDNDVEAESETTSQEASDTSISLSPVSRIELVESTKLTAESISGCIAGEGILEVAVGDSGVVWNVDLADIVGDDDLDIDLGITIGTANVDAQTLQNLATDDYMLLSLAHDGAFGFGISMSIPVAEEYAGKYANLYYYNPNNATLELIDSVKVDDSLNATFEMEHASDYVITFTDKAQVGNRFANIYIYVLIGVLVTAALVFGFIIVFTRLRNGEDRYYYDDDDLDIDIQ